MSYYLIIKELVNDEINEAFEYYEIKAKGWVINY